MIGPPAILIGSSAVLEVVQVAINKKYFGVYISQAIALNIIYSNNEGSWQQMLVDFGEREGPQLPIADLANTLRLFQPKRWRKHRVEARAIVTVNLAAISAMMATNHPVELCLGRW